jgi:hypothetical protein
MECHIRALARTINCEKPQGNRRNSIILAVKETEIFSSELGHSVRRERMEGTCLGHRKIRAVTVHRRRGGVNEFFKIKVLSYFQQFLSGFDVIFKINGKIISPACPDPCLGSMMKDVICLF